MDPRPIAHLIAPGSVRAIHQFVGGCCGGLGFPEHVESIRRTVRAAGMASEVFAATGDEDWTDLDGIRRAEDFHGFAERSVILFHALPGSPMLDQIFRRPEPVMVWHYGLVDPGLWAPWDQITAQRWGFLPSALRLLAGRSCLGIGNSIAAEEELVRMGFPVTATILPFVGVDPSLGHGGSALATPPDLATHKAMNRDAGAQSLPAGGPRWISIGGIAPHRRLEMVIAGFAAYRAAYAEGILRIAGPVEERGYANSLSRFAEEIGLGGEVELLDTGPAMARAAEVLKEADVLVTAGREATAGAMAVAGAMCVPVVSTDGTGGFQIPPGAGIMAAAVRRVLCDRDFASSVIESGARDAASRSPQGTRATWWRVLERVTGQLPAAA